MGLFSELAEPFIQGGTFGLSNLLGITGKGGLIHDESEDRESQAIWLEEEGITFRGAGIRVDWSHVTAAHVNEEGTLWTFVFRGGLCVSSGWVSSPEDPDSPVFQQLDALGDDDGILERLSALSDGSLEDCIGVAEDVLWSDEVAGRIRGTDEHLFIDEGWLFRLFTFALHQVEHNPEFVKSEELAKAESNSGKEKAADKKKAKEIAAFADRLRECLEAQFARVDIDDEDVKLAAHLALGELSDEHTATGIAGQKKVYEELCASIRYAQEGDETISRSLLAFILASSDDDDHPLGDEAWKSERKTIICTDQPMALSAFSKRKRLEGIMVMDAADIELYNEEVPAGLKLVFPAGHPQNGCTYIQHPLQANLYFEVNEFHNSLLERKQNELLRVLESLGAYSARVEVRHEQREDTNREAELQRDGKGSYGVAKGSAAYSGSESRQALSAFSQSATKDWTFNPPPKPALPDDLVFYPTEETWKNLAASVLRGGLKRATVDLEYKSEYGVTEKRLSDISASAKIVLPSFEMHLKSSFSSNLHRLTTTQWHYEAIFEDEQGKRAGDEAVPSPETATMLPKTPDDKVEALFLKKAKRYAKSEGHIDSAQRADLEAFASKYGIDEFRMEELIEEAFEA